MNSNLFIVDAIGFILFASFAMLAIAMVPGNALVIGGCIFSALGFLFSASITSGIVSENDRLQNMALVATGVSAMVALYALILGATVAFGG